MVAYSKLAFALERSISIVMGAMLKACRTAGVTVLVYHDIVDTAGKQPAKADSVDRKEFDKQMRLLKDKRYAVISLEALTSALYKGTDIPGKGVAITFDDGYRSGFTYVRPVLERYSLPATFFLATKYIGNPDKFPWLLGVKEKLGQEEGRPMNWDEVHKLHEAGFELGSHTHSHLFLPRASFENLYGELAESKKTIMERIGCCIDSIAFPYSFPLEHKQWPKFAELAAAALRLTGYLCCCTMIRGRVKNRSNPLLIKRIPVGSFDDLLSFEAKAAGGYTWTRCLQATYQKFLKKYPKSLLSKNGF